jgi:hypothetical protein
VKKRRQVKKNIPAVLTTKATEATFDGGGGDSNGEFGPAGPAPLLDGASSCENRAGGGDGVGFGTSEGSVGVMAGETT